ncbi:MAG TPA: hypothetical protein VKV28_17055 [Candidatus Binataceae bacterium]|nr:hypothetical protein [Candidatus Binataceae bacterium]
MKPPGEAKRHAPRRAIEGGSWPTSSILRPIFAALRYRHGYDPPR